MFPCVRGWDCLQGFMPQSAAVGVPPSGEPLLGFLSSCYPGWVKTWRSASPTGRCFPVCNSVGRKLHLSVRFWCAFPCLWCHHPPTGSVPLHFPPLWNVVARSSTLAFAFWMAIYMHELHSNINSALTTEIFFLNASPLPDPTSEATVIGPRLSMWPKPSQSEAFPGVFVWIWFVPPKLNVRPPHCEEMRGRTLNPTMEEGHLGGN